MLGVYINGINTTIEEARGQVEILEDLTGLKIHLRYSPTVNPIWDLLVAVYARWFGNFITRSETQRNAKFIEQLLSISSDERVHVIAHSRGCVVAMNSLNQVERGYRERITVSLFAATNFYETPGLGGVETFLNDDDYVISNLILGGLASRAIRRITLWWTKNKNQRGPLYMARGGGHSFINSYLKRLELFSGYRDSMFFKLKKENRNEEI